ncbi:hypothetical protein LC612_42445 [Nostoc sp. CHAB 5834]|nr:hypothetical protein [Nostoc sp. CHAB 5834]
MESGVFLSLDDAGAEIGDYIENYYNGMRKHSSLQYCSHVQFESNISSRTSKRLSDKTRPPTFPLPRANQDLSTQKLLSTI